MAGVSIKITGVDALRERLERKRQALLNVLDEMLLLVCEEAVTYSKEHKGYRDHTSNLKNSISFALFKDGQLLRMYEGRIPKPDERPKGQEEVNENLQGFIQQEGVVKPNGYSLAIVAGMDYGKYVEAKGYPVVYMTKHYLDTEIPKAVAEALEAVRGI